MNRPDRHRAWTSIGAAALVAVLAAAVAVAIVRADGRPDRVPAILFAAAPCLVGSLGGWLVGRLQPAEPARAVATGLAAIGLRFFPVLATAAWLQSTGGTLREHGAVGWLVRFYLALLATDVLLHIIGPRRDRDGGVSSKN